MRAGTIPAPDGTSGAMVKRVEAPPFHPPTPAPPRAASVASLPHARSPPSPPPTAFSLEEPEKVGVSRGRGAAAGDGGGRHQTIAALAPPVLRTCGDGRHARECRDPLAAAARRTFPQEARGTTHGLRSTKIDVPLRNQTWASFVHANSIQ